MADPTDDLAVTLLTDSISRSPSLFAYLVAGSRGAFKTPGVAAEEVRQRWPNMTEAERTHAFEMATRVLRQIGRDAEAQADLLDAFTATSGNG